jgi:hypothetical protein
LLLFLIVSAIAIRLMISQLSDISQ